MKKLTLAAMAALVTAMAAPAHAAPVTYSCPAGADCAGQTFAVWIEQQAGLDYVLAYSIDTGGYKGRADGAAGDFVASISFSFGLGTLDIDDIVLNAAPGGPSKWMATNDTLDANGCGHPESGKGVCVDAKDYASRPQFVVGDVLTWKVAFEADQPLPSVVHLKYLYEGPSYSKKVGKKWVETADKASGLLSFDFPVQDCTGKGVAGAPDCGNTQVPEPASLLLLGGGLVIAASRLRRRR